MRDLGNEEAVGYLQRLGDKHPGRLSLVEADLLQDGAFDAAAKDCEAVFHTARFVVFISFWSQHSSALDTALSTTSCLLMWLQYPCFSLGLFFPAVNHPFHSPFYRKPQTAEELIAPAVQGTLNVLNACQKAASVRRVVVTGSFASVIFAFDHTKETERAYCEDDWNQVSTADHPDPMHWYRASKILAERACWDFVEKQKPQFDLVVVNPPMIVGPWLEGYARPNESSMILKEFLTGGSATVWFGMDKEGHLEGLSCPCSLASLVTGEKTEVMIGGVGWVDVRDVAKAHIAALENPKAAGRYLISSESLSFLEVGKKVAGPGLEKDKLFLLG